MEQKRSSDALIKGPSVDISIDSKGNKKLKTYNIPGFENLTGKMPSDGFIDMLRMTCTDMREDNGSDVKIKEKNKKSETQSRYEITAENFSKSFNTPKSKQTAVFGRQLKIVSKK